jgi:hypothetical protein
VTGVAWHEVPDMATAVIRRWVPTYPGTAVVRRRHAGLGQRLRRRWNPQGALAAVTGMLRGWHAQTPAWADRTITALAAIVVLLGATAATA